MPAAQKTVAAGVSATSLHLGRSMGMRLVRFPTVLAVLALSLLLPGAARADTVVAPGAEAQRMTALDGTLVWITGDFGSQRLMQRTQADGVVKAVPGAPTVSSYGSLDLGRDAAGKLVLTYSRCTTSSRCSVLRDDLAGHRASVRGLAPKGCALSVAPSLWRSRTAYGLLCTKRSGKQRVSDPKRTGLYVKRGSRAATRLTLPKDARKYGIDDVSWVDLRGDRVGAVVSDVYEYAFSETASGRKTSSFLASASEGESDERVRGLAAGPGGMLWSLTDSSHAGDPNEARIAKLFPGPQSCLAFERLTNPPGPDQEMGFRAVGLAVDGATVYLSVPGTGIVEHEFKPTSSYCP